MPNIELLPNAELGITTPKLEGKNIFTRYEDKPSNLVFRWNLLWLLFVLLSTYPLWLSFVSCALTYEITIIVNIVLVVNFLIVVIRCWKFSWRMLRVFKDPYKKGIDNIERDTVAHLLVIPTYKEPLELLIETVSSVARQTVADSIFVVIGMEEKTPDKDEKINAITEKFSRSFLGMHFTVHPSGVEGEIPGACSNRNFTSRAGVQRMIDDNIIDVDPFTNEVNLKHVLVTVCDSDTSFTERYFEILTYSFLKEDSKTRHQICYQSPLFYNISLDKRWFFTRVMGLLRSVFMIGFLIGSDINTMSIYSMSLELLVRSQFFHPGYQMDDIIYTLSAMRAVGRRVRIRILDVPTFSGPTSGKTFSEELQEWILQATRWTIGAAEVFHYFFVKLLRRKYFFSGLAYFWWFVYYYGFVLCVAGLVQLFTFVIQWVGIWNSAVSIETCKPFQSWFNLSDNFPYQIVLPAFLLFVYITLFGTAFFMDAIVRNMFAIDENISFIRNFLHYLSCQLVLLAYCVVELRAIILIAIYGKKVCGHKPSKKNALVNSPNSEPNNEISPPPPALSV